MNFPNNDELDAREELQEIMSAQSTMNSSDLRSSFDLWQDMIALEEQSKNFASNNSANNTPPEPLPPPPLPLANKDNFTKREKSIKLSREEFAKKIKARREEAKKMKKNVADKQIIQSSKPLKSKVKAIYLDRELTKSPKLATDEGLEDKNGKENEKKATKLDASKNEAKIAELRDSDKSVTKNGKGGKGDKGKSKTNDGDFVQGKTDSQQKTGANITAQNGKVRTEIGNTSRIDALNTWTKEKFSNSFEISPLGLLAVGIGAIVLYKYASAGFSALRSRFSFSPKASGAVTMGKSKKSVSSKTKARGFFAKSKSPSKTVTKSTIFDDPLEDSFDKLFENPPASDTSTNASAAKIQDTINTNEVTDQKSIKSSSASIAPAFVAAAANDKSLRKKFTKSQTASSKKSFKAAFAKRKKLEESEDKSKLSANNTRNIKHKSSTDFLNRNSKNNLNKSENDNLTQTAPPKTDTETQTLTNERNLSEFSGKFAKNSPQNLTPTKAKSSNTTFSSSSQSSASLLDLPGMNEETVKKLKTFGISSLEQIANADSQQAYRIGNILGDFNIFKTNSWRERANELLRRTSLQNSSSSHPKLANFISATSKTTPQTNTQEEPQKEPQKEPIAKLPSMNVNQQANQQANQQKQFSDSSKLEVTQNSNASESNVLPASAMLAFLEEEQFNS